VHPRCVLSLITLSYLILGDTSGDGLLLNQPPAHYSWADVATALPPQGRKASDGGIMCQVVYLTSKGNNHVMAGERQFNLLPGSVLQDAQKKPLALNDITLPCHASFCYWLTVNRRDAYLVSLCLIPERKR
jgi:hypothetical protein